MPIPSRKKGESEDKFISRCISFLSKEGTGKDRSQRFAICKSKAATQLTDEEMEAVKIFAQKLITNLNPPLKKKKKDKYRITKEDGSGTDDTAM